MALTAWTGSLILTGFLWKLQLIALEGAHPTGLQACYRLLEVDSIFFTVMFSLIAGSLFWRQFLLRPSALVLAVVGSTWYALDALALKTLDRHASWQALSVFANASTVVRAESPRVILAFLPSLLLTFIAYRYFPQARRASRRVFLILAILPIPFTFQKASDAYDRLGFLNALKVERWEEPKVSAHQIASVLGTNAKETVRQHFFAEIPPGHPDLILVVVESFSSALSKRAGGVYDYFPLTERAMSKGTLFSNFFANGENSCVGLISLLSGLLPLAFSPRNNNLTDLYRVFQNMPSVVHAYHGAGYETLYATASDWWSQPTKEYLTHIGIQEYLDPTNTPLMKRFAKVSGFFSDEALYATALSKLPVSTRAVRMPFFWTLVTLESHDIAADAASWHEVDRKLASFVDALERRKFFEHGILIVTGDHRLRAGYPAEFAKAKKEAGRARVPLWLRGEGVAAGLEDTRYFQQADLLRLLGRAISKGIQPLSPAVVFLDDFLGLAPIRVLAIDEQSVSPGVVSGLLTFWKDTPPKNHRAFEQQIERNQAIQHLRLGELASGP